MLDYSNQAMWSNNFGQSQSPIHLDSKKAVVHNRQNLPVSFHGAYNLDVEYNDHTTIRLTGDGFANIFNRPFNFKQVHFHAPAEHTIDDKKFPFEIHMVHQNSIGQSVVVSLLPNLGDPNNDLQEIIDNFDENKNKPVNINIPSWLPKRANGFHYLGSLTTPPLSEGIEWVIITNPSLTVSQEQVNWFKQQFGTNNRDLQPDNGRLVELYYQEVKPIHKNLNQQFR